MSDKIIKKTTGMNSIVFYLIALFIFPILLLLSFSVKDKVLYLFPVLITVIFVWLRMYRFVIFDKGIEKKYLKGKSIFYDKSKVHFRFLSGEANNDNHAIKAILEFKGRKVGVIGFSHVNDIEKFVLKTRQCGYSWSLPPLSYTLYADIRKMLEGEP